MCVCVVLRCLCGCECVLMIMMVSVPERSKGVDSSSTVFALVGSNPTADISFSSSLLHRAARSLCPSLQRVVVLWFCGLVVLWSCGLVVRSWLLAPCSSSLLLGPACAVSRANPGDDADV